MGESGSESGKPLDSLEDASETLQSVLDGLRGRLAGEEAAGLGAVAALLEKMKGRGDEVEQTMVKERQEQVWREEGGGVILSSSIARARVHVFFVFQCCSLYHRTSIRAASPLSFTQYGRGEMRFEPTAPEGTVN